MYDAEYYKNIEFSQEFLDALEEERAKIQIKRWHKKFVWKGQPERTEHIRGTCVGGRSSKLRRHRPSKYHPQPQPTNIDEDEDNPNIDKE